MDASKVFERRTLTLEDDRFDHGEVGIQTNGVLDVRVRVVATPRDEARHVISIRHCHGREAWKIDKRMG
jgi:hypothetical protein